MCYCGEFDRNDFEVTRTRKARKVHWCCECRSDIVIGERYEEITVGGDGSVSRYRMCGACDADLAVFQSLARLTSCGSFCWLFGDMDQCAKELVEEAEYEVRQDKMRLRTPVDDEPSEAKSDAREPLIVASKERLDSAQNRYRAALARVQKSDDAVLSLGA